MEVGGDALGRRARQVRECKDGSRAGNQRPRVEKSQRAALSEYVTCHRGQNEAQPTTRSTLVCCVSTYGPGVVHLLLLR